MPLIANVAVKILFCPKTAIAAENPIRLMGGKRFDRMHDVGNSETRHRRQQNMSVIGHYHPRDQLIPLAVPFQKRFLQDGCDASIAQMTGAVILVKVSFYPSAMVGVRDLTAE